MRIPELPFCYFCVQAVNSLLSSVPPTPPALVTRLSDPSISSWADSVRTTAPYKFSANMHFINMPDSMYFYVYNESNVVARARIYVLRCVNVALAHKRDLFSPFLYAAYFIPFFNFFRNMQF